MQLFHTGTSLSASFDEPNLVSAAGLVPVMALALESGLRDLADDWLSVPTDKGANAGLAASLVNTASGRGDLHRGDGCHRAAGRLSAAAAGL